MDILLQSFVGKSTQTGPCPPKHVNNKEFVLQDLLKYSKIGHLYFLSKRAPIFWPDELPEYILVYLTSG